MTNSHLANGIAVIHSNQLESLAEVVQYWLSTNPLPPLENDVFLVNNNGMGHWIKQNIAHNQALGIAAGIDASGSTLAADVMAGDFDGFRRCQ